MRQLATFLLLAAALARGQECIEVSGPWVFASQLLNPIPMMQTLPPDTKVLPAPPIGVVRTMRTQDWTSVARRFHMRADWPEEQVCFKQKSRPISSAEWHEALAKALVEVGPVRSWQILDTSKGEVPLGALELPIAGLSLLGGDRYLWRGHVRDKKGYSVIVWAQLRCTAEREVLVARRDLRAGEPLSEAVLFPEKRPTTLVAPPPASLSGIRGMTLRRSIAQGSEICPLDLVQPLIVRSGQSLRVEVRSQGASLAFNAIAIQSGRLGGSILVENPSNRRRFRAQVTGPATALVDPNWKGRT